jgi:hypothetical protein
VKRGDLRVGQTRRRDIPASNGRRRARLQRRVWSGLHAAAPLLVVTALRDINDDLDEAQIGKEKET